jgi:hypothetical protein
MKCRRVLGESNRYWNIKGRYRFAVVFSLNLLCFLHFPRYRVEQIVVPPRYRA